LLGGAVDLGEGDRLVFEGGGSLFIFGREGFAMAAPWCEDYDEVLAFMRLMMRCI